MSESVDLELALDGRTPFHFWQWISDLENAQHYTNEVTALLARMCGALGMPEPPEHLTFPRGSTALEEARKPMRAEVARHYIEHAKDAPTEHDCTEWGCGCMGCFDRADGCEILLSLVPHP